MQYGLPAADHVHMTQIHLVTTKMRCNVYTLAFACKVFQNSLVMLKAIAVTHISADCRIQSLQNYNKTVMLSSTQLIVFITKCGYMFRPIIRSSSGHSCTYTQTYTLRWWVWSQVRPCV